MYATSATIEELLHFHENILVIVFLTSSLVLYIISLLLTTKLTHTSTIDTQELETIWTILQAIMLILIALPSLQSLYVIDKINNPSLTVKTMSPMILKLRIYRLWRLEFWCLQNSNNRVKIRRVVTIENR